MHQNNPTNHKTTQIRILYGCMVCVLFFMLVIVWFCMNMFSIDDMMSLGGLAVILEMMALSMAIIRYFQQKINQIKSR